MSKNYYTYQNYWKRKQLLNSQAPHVPLRYWWQSSNLCDVEKVYFPILLSSESVLDVGAGDMQVNSKLQSLGFTGEYHSQDISTEYEYTYSTIGEIEREYDAILCMDVIEHLNVEDGLEMLCKLTSMLSKSGSLIVQTPNGRSLFNAMGNDMTHLHLYNAQDLWSYFVALGFKVEVYRSVFHNPQCNMHARIKHFLKKFLIAKVLGSDYADNILVLINR